ncbi:MAG: PorP/SprF family type IX secretion system membrane protein [bacterium]|nr:PorP/SprF family type IX secretion system membrane protein [bacterium]
MRKRILYILFGVSVFVFVKAQDIHFSQFNEHPALINPALTATNGKYRAYLGYKNQWRTVSTPYKTYGASFEFQPVDGPWKKSKRKLAKNYREQNIGRLGMGLSVYRDKAGDGDMGLTQVNLSVATFVPTGHWSYLSFGIQGSSASRRSNAANFIYPNQYNGSGYDAGMNSGENVTGDKFKYADFSAGMLWSYSYVEKNFANSKQIKFRLGGSAYHLTQPDLQTIGNRAEKLLMKYVAHGDMVFSLGKSQVALAPSFLVQVQGPSSELIVGSLLKYYVTNGTKFTGKAKSTCLNFGVFYRTEDAVILNFAILYQEQYSFGLSYDLNISPLREASRVRGGLEFALRITPQEDYLFRK